MDIFIGAVSIFSLALNYLVYRRIVALHKVINGPSGEMLLQEEESQPVEVPVTVQMVQDVYLSRALPSRSNTPSGPLERPGGFAS